jgi:hypothetical protein
MGMSQSGVKGEVLAEGGPGGVRDLYGALRPVASLATCLVQLSPIAWVVAHFWSLPPDGFWRAWFLEPEVFLPFWLVTSLVIWASFVTMLVLARFPTTRRLLLKDAAAYQAFGRRVAEATVVWTFLSIIAGFLCYELSGR